MNPDQSVLLQDLFDKLRQFAGCSVRIKLNDGTNMQATLPVEEDFISISRASMRILFYNKPGMIAIDLRIGAILDIQQTGRGTFLMFDRHNNILSRGESGGWSFARPGSAVALALSVVPSDSERCKILENCGLPGDLDVRVDLWEEPFPEEDLAYTFVVPESTRAVALALHEHITSFEEKDGVGTSVRVILKDANNWSPQEGWGDRAILIGRDILNSSPVNEQVIEGLLYINPGRDHATARRAHDYLVDRLKMLVESSEHGNYQASFILSCVAAQGWCSTRQIVKIVAEANCIEVYVMDPDCLWPNPPTSGWPEEWQFYKTERYIRWDGEPKSAGIYAPKQMGPCADGTWPILCSAFLGCICCTNGLPAMAFVQCWCCPPISDCECMKRQAMVVFAEEDMPSPREILRVRNIDPTLRDRWEGLRIPKMAAELLTSMRPQEVPGELVRRSITEGMPLEERLAAEEIAGLIGRRIMDATKREDKDERH